MKNIIAKIWCGYNLRGVRQAERDTHRATERGTREIDGQTQREGERDSETVRDKERQIDTER